MVLATLFAAHNHYLFLLVLLIRFFRLRLSQLRVFRLFFVQVHARRKTVRRRSVASPGVCPFVTSFVLVDESSLACLTVVCVGIRPCIVGAVVVVGAVSEFMLC